MRKWLTAISIAIMAFAVLSSKAQTDGLGSWSVANVRYAFSPHWITWSEYQLRSYHFYNHFFYHEIKGGVQYNLTENVSLLVGVGRYRTYSVDGSFKSPLTADELRLWEQLTLTNNIHRVKLEHRYRVEQRWFTTGYRNRFRYRFSPIVPLANHKLQPRTFFLTGFNEIFLTSKAPYFERNRSFLGLGYQVSRVLTLQSGYCYQYDYRANGSSVTNHFLQTTLFLNFKHPDSKREYHPGTID